MAVIQSATQVYNVSTCSYNIIADGIEYFVIQKYLKMDYIKQTLFIELSENLQKNFDELRNQIHDLKKIHQSKLHTSYLTSKEICKLLKNSHRTFQRYVKDGVLTKFYIGGKIFFRLEDIESALVKFKN